MKAPCYRQTLICIFILLFSVNLWAKEDMPGKVPVATAKNSTDRTSVRPVSKGSTAKIPEKTDALPTKQQADDAETAGQDADIKTGAPQTEPQTSTAPFREPIPGKTPSEAEYWVHKVDRLIENREQVEQADIDALYAELTTAFDVNSEKLGKQLREKQRDADSHEDVPARVGTMPYRTSGTHEERYHTVNTLYYQRLRLLEDKSTESLEDVTGTGVEGMQELNRELTFLKQTLFYHIEGLPQLRENLVNDLSIAPLPTLGNFLLFVIALVLFRYWRRWAPEGLVKIRRRLIKMRPRTKKNRRLTKLIWYFDQVRPPVAWFVLLSLMFSFIEDPALIFFIEVARITANWVLISWLGVLFINALIARSSRSLKKETAGLTLRSLKYVGTWFVFNGLTLGLISRYAGEGTLYAWMLSINEAFLVFLLAVLVIIWRPNILQGLENDPQENFISEAILKHKKGLVSYLYCILGAGLLLRVYISKKFIIWIADFNTGQEMLDSLLGIEMAKAYRRQKDDADVTPIPPDLKEKLIRSGEVLIEQAGRVVLKEILSRADKGLGGAIVLVGETGGGKTVLLQRVSKETAKKSLLVSCPKGGLDAFLKELARKLHVDSEAPKQHVIFEALKKRKIEVLLIDNIHWLIRPYVGGQVQLDKLAELFLYAPDVFCVLSTNSATWQYILRARAKLILDKNALILQPWSVDLIATLIKNFCEAANIDPDFSKVIIPRQFDDSNFDDPKARIFSGFIRILHGAATGNPMVALGLWIKSLCMNKDGGIVVQLPRLPSSEELDNAKLTVLLVLRVICQSEIINHEDIVKSLQISDAEVINSLRVSINNEWVEIIDEEYYQLTWYWRKVITRVLSRQNLMPRIF